MSPKSKTEGLLFGSIEMVRGVLIRFGIDCGVGVVPKDFPMLGHAYQLFELYALPEKTFGSIEIQQLPNERVLITFNPIPPHTKLEDMTEDQFKRFEQFVTAIVERLTELGFIPLPEPQQPKRPMGFAPD